MHSSVQACKNGHEWTADNPETLRNLADYLEETNTAE